LFVDVNLGGGKTERIIIYEGDSSSELSEAFAAKYSKVTLYHTLDLNDEKKLKFKEMLDF
jgi:hypothetical protein